MSHQRAIHFLTELAEPFIEQTKLFIPALGTISLLALRNNVQQVNEYMEFVTNGLGLISGVLAVAYYIISIRVKRREMNKKS